MAREITVAGIQTSFSKSKEENIERVTALIRQAGGVGAQIVLPPELFESHYFCTEESESNFSLAHPTENHPTLDHFSHFAKELSVVIPVSFFERDGQSFYNSIAIIDADGSILGVYRKSHIPDGPGYEEKFYFRPGNTGFKVWQTRYAKIGVGICWDQWFPECARSMTLMGAELLFYPTAIGSEPNAPDLDTKGPWRRAMLGHAVSNIIPVVAANRIGTEGEQTYYGHSFVADELGNLVSELSAEEGIVSASIDLDSVDATRAAFGFFRDRRPELYSEITKSR